MTTNESQTQTEPQQTPAVTARDEKARLEFLQNWCAHQRATLERQFLRGEITYAEFCQRLNDAWGVILRAEDKYLRVEAGQQVKQAAAAAGGDESRD